MFYATSLGDLKTDAPKSSSSMRITVKDALYAPDPDTTLTVIPISKIAKAGYTVSFECKGGCRIKNKDGKMIGKIPASAIREWVVRLYRVEHPITAKYYKLDREVQLRSRQFRVPLGGPSSNQGSQASCVPIHPAIEYLCP